MISRPAFENHRDGQRDEEKPSEKYQHEVQLERRVNLADVRKRQRPGEKYRRTLEQSPAEHDLRGR